jgi:hypothetical protein
MAMLPVFVAVQPRLQYFAMIRQLSRFRDNGQIEIKPK